MAAEDYDIPIFVVTGFLESGKTSFIKDTVAADYFQIEEPTLLITTEEGEEEYDRGMLLDHNTLLEVITEKEELTSEKLEELNRKHRPERVIIEFNPLWGVEEFRKMKLPAKWGFLQQIVTVDCNTFSIYMNNMKSLFSDMATSADMVVFNRVNQNLPLSNYRRSIMAVNPATEIVFEGPDGVPIDIFTDTVPYDLDAPIIEIEDVDYGIFYIDLTDNPERYIGKTVRFKGVALKSKMAVGNQFVPGRKAMTCCADDIRYIGYLTNYERLSELEVGKWYKITASVTTGYSKAYRGEGPILNASEVEPCDPPLSELVYFN